MRKRLVTGLVAVVVLAAVAALALVAGDGSTPDPHAGAADIAGAERDRVLRAVEAANGSATKAELEAEGRRLFRSSALAKRGESCQSCHTEGGGANASLGTTPNAAGDFKRDPPALWDIEKTAPYGWVGKQPSLEAFVTGTINAHFKDSSDAALKARQTAALVAYVKTLDPPRTSFDQGTMSTRALQGEDLFQGKAACIECHGGPQFTDNGLHNLLADPAPAGADALRIPGDAVDPGFSGDPANPLFHAFNTPQLRDVRNTRPYFHNGKLKTLREVIDFYDAQSLIAPLGLTEAEKEALEEYLKSL